MEERLHPVRSVADLTFGALPPRKRPENFRELREAFKEEIVENETRTYLKTWRRKGLLG